MIYQNLRKMTLLTVLLISTLCNAGLNIEKPATTGLASYYGKREQGKRTASGERFDRRKYTAASRFYPLGTLLMVKYPRCGTFVVVRVNDRGPFKKGRVLDLSERAAQTLGLKPFGVGHVIIEPREAKMTALELEYWHAVLTLDFLTAKLLAAALLADNGLVEPTSE
jgi:rare lipoprotein A (peptidoglycan hydrolase)